MTTDYTQNQQISPKAVYLICLSHKTKEMYFVTTDKPDISTSFVLVKGFYYTGELNEEFYSKFRDIIKDTLEKEKDKVLEIMFPVGKINYIRSLVFKAK